MSVTRFDHINLITITLNNKISSLPDYRRERHTYLRDVENNSMVGNFFVMSTGTNIERNYNGDTGDFAHTEHNYCVTSIARMRHWFSVHFFYVGCDVRVHKRKCRLSGWSRFARSNIVLILFYGEKNPIT